MKKPKRNQPILKSSAYIWDGNKQLSGVLSLFHDAVCFNFNDFPKSKIELRISIVTINAVEEFLLFDLDRKGLKIKSNANAEDLFITEKSNQFKKEIDKILLLQKSKK